MAGALLLAVAGCAFATSREPLTVCADPDNLPYSNRAGEGFENHLAELLAARLHRPLRYTWWVQRRGFLRKTLAQSRCELWPGVASGIEQVETTRPYYRSTYVFVSREDRPLEHLTLDDPRLKSLRLGVQMIGMEGNNTPPALALARRGIIDNVRGYMVYDRSFQPQRQAPAIDAVERGLLDVALMWGPRAGWFASHAHVPLRLEPVTPVSDGSRLPMVYAISVGVRRGDRALRDRIDQALDSLQPSIQRLLRQYHVPLVQG